MKLHIHRKGENFGPYTLEEVNGYLADGSMSLRDMAYHEGLADWAPLADINGVIVPDGHAATAPSSPNASKGGRKGLFVSIGAGVAAAVVGTICFIKFGGGHKGGDLRAALAGDGAAANISFDADESG